jgi:hypothetical protein
MQRVSIADALLHASAVMCRPFLQVLNKIDRSEAALLQQTGDNLPPHLKLRFNTALARNPRLASGAANAPINQAIVAPPAPAPSAATPSAAAAKQAVLAPPAAANLSSALAGAAGLQVSKQFSVVSTSCFLDSFTTCCLP